MKKLFFLVFLLVTFGCSKSDDLNASDNGVSWDQLGSAPKVDVPKESLPEWLVVRINDFYEIRPQSYCKVQIYKGKWNSKTVYFIFDTYIHLSTSYLCEFFSENGIIISDNNLSDLRLTSKNWILIYEYGEMSLNFEELFKNL